MEYQEIVTKYKNKSLAIGNIRNKLEQAKPLKARPRYRVLDMNSKSFFYHCEIVDLLKMQEDSKKFNYFDEQTQSIVKRYFNDLMGRIQSCKAWDYMGIKARDFSNERFENASLQEKFAIIYELNQKYCRFLEYQKLADLRGMFIEQDEEPDEQTLMKMCFFLLMFENFKSDNVKKEFFCFDKHFLHALLRYKKSKDTRLEDHMKGQKRKIALEYEKFETFFSTEDYRDIIENILLSNKATKLSKTEIMRIFSQISETEAEQEYLHSEAKIFRQLEEKSHKMDEVRSDYQKDKIEREKREREESLEKERIRKAEELKRKQEIEKITAERNRIIGKNEGYTEELDNKISTLQKTLTVKEAVVPIILVWLDKEDISLTKKLGNQTLATFFARIKRIELETGRRASLFLITNANQDITQKRVEDLRKKSEVVGLPRLVEGALGGYSSFRVDETGKVKDVSKMSPENREKIKVLLESSFHANLPRSLIDETETNYLRYKFADKPDKSLSKTYLAMMVGRLLEDERISKQPLELIPFIERKAVGIDVVLGSQVKGLAKIHDYYESKYNIVRGKSYQIKIEEISKFLGKNKDDNKEIDEPS